MRRRRPATSTRASRAALCVAGSLIAMACLAATGAPHPVNLARLPGVRVEGTADPRPFYALPNAFDAGTTRINDIAYTSWTAEANAPGPCRWARLKLPVPARLERVLVYPKRPLRESHISLVADGELVAHVQVTEVLEGESVALQPKREVLDVRELVIAFSRAVGAIPVAHGYGISIEEIEVQGHVPGAAVESATPVLTDGEPPRFECPVQPPADIVAKAVELKEGEYRFQLWETLDWPAKMGAHGDPSILNARSESEVVDRDDVECVIYSCRYRVKLELDPAVRAASFHLVSIDGHARLTPTHLYAIQQFPRRFFEAAGPPYGEAAARMSQPFSHGEDIFVLQSARPLDIEHVALEREHVEGRGFVDWIGPQLLHHGAEGKQVRLTPGVAAAEILGVAGAARILVDSTPRYLIVRYLKAPDSFCAESTDLFELSDPPRLAVYQNRGCDI